MFVIYGQESGTSSQTLVTSGAMERLGSSFLEPSLTTRDALDKFQIVAHKVVANLSDYCVSLCISHYRRLI